MNGLGEKDEREQDNLAQLEASKLRVPVPEPVRVPVRMSAAGRVVVFTESPDGGVPCGEEFVRVAGEGYQDCLEARVAVYLIGMQSHGCRLVRVEVTG